MRGGKRLDENLKNYQMNNYQKLREKITEAVLVNKGRHDLTLTLADVMLTLSQDISLMVMLDSDGWFHKGIKADCQWDFTKDLDGQSEETKNYLYNLICGDERT